MCELGKKVVRRGIKQRLSTLCKYELCNAMILPNLALSRTYDDEHEGEVVREGFDPNESDVTADSNFAVGDNDDNDEPEHIGHMHKNSEEARVWHEGNDGGAESPPKADTHHGPLEDPWRVTDSEEA